MSFIKRPDAFSEKETSGEEAALSQSCKLQRRSKTKMLIFTALFSALIAAGAFIKIPFPLIPFTMQLFFVTMSWFILGGKYGALSSFVYMATGLIGIPVFTAGGGLWYVLKPSFGYIIGFCVGGLVAGIIMDKSAKKTYKIYLLSGFAGVMTVYLIGMIYCYVLSNYIINTPIAVWPLIVNCFLMTIPSDIVFTFVAAFAALKLKPVFDKMIKR